ncbi:hypothetical protein HNY73_009137 [Argiope bruennichi]|uniref:Uncharacterized protein n=1 Tax=Argiope bruennichi TaxID=94029 RepID=A0A8T0F8L6_ARGBR|nr:hypothetical protein HNY73_009137 [Argiope bruennichi]
MSDSVNSTPTTRRLEEQIRDIKLVKTLLRYVLHDYYPAINWKPYGIFHGDTDNSPCCVTIKSAIKLHLDTYGGDIHEFYDEDFTQKDGIGDRCHSEVLEYVKDDFEMKPFEFSKFLNYFCMSAEYAALSYLYGVKRAPLITLQILCTTMREMREYGIITEDFWNDFEKFCENFVQTERRRGFGRKDGNSNR